MSTTREIEKDRPARPGEIRPPTAIDRREAIRRVSMMLGGVALVGGSGLLTACESAERPRAGAAEPVGDFTADQVALLDEIAETILPETGTPGAKAAAVGAFMALMVTDTYDTDDQAIFLAGLGRVDEECSREHGLSFMDATGPQRLGLLERLDQEQMAHEEAGTAGGTHYFRMMKQLSLLGYFTSEIGVTVAQQYVEAPGRFDPCVPYAPGEASWANHA